MHFGLFDQHFFRVLQLGDPALDIQTHVVGLQIAVYLAGVHKLWNLDFKNDAGLVRGLIVAPLVLALVAQPDLAVLVVDWHLPLLVVLLLVVVVVLEHAVLLATGLSLRLLLYLLLVGFAAEGFAVGVFVRASFFVEDFLFDSSAGSLRQVRLYVMELLLGLHLPGLRNLIAVNPSKSRNPGY